MATLTALGPDGYPPGWCFHHECEHGPMEWSDLCQSPDDGDEQAFRRVHGRIQAIWDAAERADRARKRRWWRWPKVVFYCWWAHGTRKVADGVWESNWCWACTGIGRRKL